METNKPAKQTLYSISEDLDKLFDMIEENGGEITPEIEEALAIKQEQLVSKLDGYSTAYRMLNNNVNACKDEIKRIQAIKKSSERNLELLKNSMANAVEKYGEETKTGSKFIDLPMGKVSVRPSSGTVLDEEFLDDVIRMTIEYIKELRNNKDWFHNDTENHLIDLENRMNEYFAEKAEKGGTEAYMVDDDVLDSINVSYTVTGTIYNMLCNKFISSFMSIEDGELKNITSITDAKNFISEGKPVIYAYKNNNKVLSIK